MVFISLSFSIVLYIHRNRKLYKWQGKGRVRKTTTETGAEEDRLTDGPV